MIHGIATSTDFKSGILLVDVQVARAGVTYKNVPVLHQFPGHIQSITEGSRVVLEQTEDNLWVILGVLETDSDLLTEKPVAYEQVMAFDDGTEISVKEAESGGYDVNINASSELNIKATGDVTVETEGHLQFKSSSVDFDTSGGSA
ncbi:baseplate assembly protein V [Halorubrum sodomense tailed virus 4]|uniref:Baseplate assembly protein V n=1 Tax=Halorubrum sodomense tailed virus 4 TaxID=2878013 RepID=A0AAE8XTS1_9CAUD|nr:baseplate assembly protein V [Halorubrum sodomense tailed virus 4]UBF19734.1 baseplate assembly protein V [Halorubrum virus HRTV-18]UBF19857.1 baseplate assembly protein V [Halorubrum virus HRTV-20]UBF20232.1 baseplate assembly protein V [Halorubrum sodomense tailed virus 4]